MLFLRPVQKGFCLYQVDIKGLDIAAPLIFNLGIPVDMCVPDVPDPREFALGVLSSLSPECDLAIIDLHNESREDKADLFIAVIDITDTTSLPMTGKVQWKIEHFSCHKRDYDDLVGVNNYVYYNISKRIDMLRIN
jgi:hypothetical protein